MQGGEEFAVIITGINELGVIKLANNIRKSISKLNIKHENSDISDLLTISIGIKMFDPNNDKLDFDTIYKCADEALYEAKQKGRDSIVLQ